MGDGEGAGTGSGTGSGTGTITDWRSKYSEDIKNHPSLEKYKSEEEALKGFIESQKLIGRDKIAIPGSDANPEEWGQVFDKLGRPKEPGQYEFEKVELPEGLEASKDTIGEYQKIAHEAGLNSRQANHLFKWYMGLTAAQYKTMQGNQEQDRLESERKLRQDWGLSFDQNLAIAKQVIKKFGDPELNKYLEESGAGNNPAFVRFINSIGKNFSEDVLQGGTSSLTMSPKEANDMILKIQMDKSHPYWVQDHPEHKAAVAQMEQLFAMANPPGV